MAGHTTTGKKYHVVPMGMVDGFNNIICDMNGGWTVISYHIYFAIQHAIFISLYIFRYVRDINKQFKP